MLSPLFVFCFFFLYVPSTSVFVLQFAFCSCGTQRRNRAGRIAHTYAVVVPTVQVANQLLCGTWKKRLLSSSYKLTSRGFKAELHVRNSFFFCQNLAISFSKTGHFLKSEYHIKMTRF